MSYQLEIAKQQIVEKNVFVRNCSQVSWSEQKLRSIFRLSLDLSERHPRSLSEQHSGRYSEVVRFRINFKNRSIHRCKNEHGLSDIPWGPLLIQLYILLTLVLTFDAIVRYRQRHRRLALSIHFNVHLLENRFPVLFEPFSLKHVYEDTHEYDMADYRQADQNVINFLKYLMNFAFYRFGLEVRSTDRRLHLHLFLWNRHVTSPRWSSLVFVSMSWRFSMPSGLASFWSLVDVPFNVSGPSTSSFKSLLFLRNTWVPSVLHRTSASVRPASMLSLTQDRRSL